MSKAFLTFALGATALAAPFATASAQDMRQRGPGAAMMRADANGDGIVTRAEALAEAGARFDRMDANHDGKIDQAELAAMAEMRRGRRGDAAPAPTAMPAPVITTAPVK